MGLRIFSDTVTPLSVNAYVVSDEESGDAVVIDPGEFSEPIRDHLRLFSLHVHYILFTHGHFDHIAGADEAASQTRAPLVCHDKDDILFTDPFLNGSALFGLPSTIRTPRLVTQDGETLEAGNLSFRVIHTPGHTPGGVCYLTGLDLFSGDTLFAGAIGRSDLPGGDGQTLLRSIHDQLLVLPSETSVHPGHGPSTSIGRERDTNPFLHRQ
jgi:hydroxyacylglutathione hydrolase